MSASSGTRLLSLAALVGGLVALAGGWIAFGGEAPARPRERYVEGVVGAPVRINPLLAGDNQVDADLAALIFSGLTRIDGDGTPLPDLAERWEITPDGRTYTFHLRGDVFWHDGERLDSADIAFTVALVQDPGFPGPPDLAARWAGIEVLVVDASTVILRLPAPSASFVAQAALGIVPEHLLAASTGPALADAAFNRAPAGTGPYRLTKLNGEAARLEQHSGYHLGTPQLDEIELRFYPDATALAIALDDGRIDGALLAEPRLDASQRLIPLTEAGYLLLYLNTRRAPLDDPRLRRALAAAIDPADAPAIVGGGLPGEGPFVPGSWAHTDVRLANPAAAGALFDTAGWRLNPAGQRAADGVPLALDIASGDDPIRVALAEHAAEQLRAHGVEVRVSVLPAQRLFRERLEPREFDLLLFGWRPGADPDPYSAWHTSQIATGRNVAGHHDSEADALLEAARVSVDVAERIELYASFAGRFVTAAPSVILLYPQRHYAVPPDLRDIDRGLLFTPAARFRDVHLWHFDP